MLNRILSRFTTSALINQGDNILKEHKERIINVSCTLLGIGLTMLYNDRKFFIKEIQNLSESVAILKEKEVSLSSNLLVVPALAESLTILKEKETSLSRNMSEIASNLKRNCIDIQSIKVQMEYIIKELHTNSQEISVISKQNACISEKINLLIDISRGKLASNSSYI